MSLRERTGSELEGVFSYLNTVYPPPGEKYVKFHKLARIMNRSHFAQQIYYCLEFSSKSQKCQNLIDIFQLLTWWEEKQEIVDVGYGAPNQKPKHSGTEMQRDYPEFKASLEPERGN